MPDGSCQVRLAAAEAEQRQRRCPEEAAAAEDALCAGPAHLLPGEGHSRAGGAGGAGGAGQGRAGAAPSSPRSWRSAPRLSLPSWLLLRPGLRL